MTGSGGFPWQPKQPWRPPMVAPSRVDVSPAMVDGAAKNFAVGQRDLIDAWTRLRGGLAANAGMAGNDKAAKVFNATYAPAVGTVWKVFRQATVVIGGTSLGLTQTANNHLSADHHSRADGSGGALMLLGPNDVYPDMSLAAPPSAIGPAATGPYFGANRVLATLLVGYWPAAHPNNLEDAAGKWYAAASEVNKVAEWLNWSIGRLADSSQTRDVAAIQRYWRKIYQAGDGHSLLGGLIKLCNALGDACDRYAGVTWRTQKRINLVVSSQEVLIALSAGIEGVLAKLSTIFDRIAAAGVAAVGREVGAAITEDVVAEAESAAAGTPKIEPIEADFEATAGKAIQKELSQTSSDAVGAAREERVAELTNGRIPSGAPGKMGMKITQPGVGSSDVDVIGSDGSYIQVGGPAKAKNLAKLGQKLHILKWAAGNDGVGAQAYFEEGTPESALNLARKILGAENVHVF